MSLKARINKIEKRFPRLTEEDMVPLELSFRGAEPSLEEEEIALEHVGQLDPPWTIIYIPHDFKNVLEKQEYLVWDHTLGLYWDGDIMYKLVEKYDKTEVYSSNNEINTHELCDMDAECLNYYLNAMSLRSTLSKEEGSIRIDQIEKMRSLFNDSTADSE